MFRTGKIKLNQQINLPFNFLIQKYFFHDNPTWNINNSEYIFQVLGAPTHDNNYQAKRVGKKTDLELKNLELNWN